MQTKNVIIKIEELFNISLVLAIILISTMAFIFQIGFKELPCPLCLLQRVGFLLISFGALLNLRFQIHPGHYSLILLSALLTCFISLRQVALHVIPGTGSYGMAIFGLHLYTWSFIFSMMIIIVTSIMLGVKQQYQVASNHFNNHKIIVKILFAAILTLTGANIISTILECGFKACPDNPTQYELLKS